MSEPDELIGSESSPPMSGGVLLKTFWYVSDRKPENPTALSGVVRPSSAPVVRFTPMLLVLNTSERMTPVVGSTTSLMNAYDGKLEADL